MFALRPLGGPSRYGDAPGESKSLLADEAECEVFESSADEEKTSLGAGLGGRAMCCGALPERMASVGSLCRLWSDCGSQCYRVRSDAGGGTVLSRRVSWSPRIAWSVE